MAVDTIGNLNMENLFASSLQFIINVYSPHNILTVYYAITKVASLIGTLTWSTTKVASFNGSSLSAGTSASCPYCTGAKLDKNGRETNGKGTFVKGEPRTMKNLREDAEEMVCKSVQC